MGITFEWDNNKAKTNVLKHDVSFEESATIFSDERTITIHDIIHSVSEKRWITIGRSVKNRVIVVVHTERNNRIRIISSRKASKKEKKQYEEK